MQPDEGLHYHGERRVVVKSLLQSTMVVLKTAGGIAHEVEIGNTLQLLSTY
jgi:hypothetical protein